MNTHALPGRCFLAVVCFFFVPVQIARSLSVALPPDRQSAAIHTFLPGAEPSWQMVSAPFTGGDSFASTGLYAAAWDPASNQYNIVPNPPADSFHAGRGYWAYLTQPVSVQTAGTPADRSQPFPIILQQGWNMIGDPFDAAVPLSSLSVLDSGGGQKSFTAATALGAVSPLYTLGGGASYLMLSGPGQFLPPWTAAWVYATTPVTLFVPPPPPASKTNSYGQTNLVADAAGSAPNLDTNLTDPWGIIVTPLGNVRVVDEGANVSTIYQGNGGAFHGESSDATEAAGIIKMYPRAPGSPSSHPTSVYYGGVGIRPVVLSIGEIVETPVLVFSTATGTLQDSAVGNDLGDFAAPQVAGADQSSRGSVYTGVNFALLGASPFTWAANFHLGVLDRFDRGLRLVNSITDPAIPAGFAPFNVANIGGNLYVSYAKQAADGVHDQPGPGNGFIDIFTPDGSTVYRLVSNGVLNSPWGMAVAPGDFGSFSNALLVANHGDGKINAFDLSTGAYLGALADTTGNPIIIDGLWGIVFGNGAGLTQTNTLYFTAGPAGGTHGLLGKIEVAGLATGSAGN